jgi:ADP-ribosylglycohydrolase
MLGPPDRHRFLFGRGMMSDDGEHACMTAQALCVAGGDVQRFRRSLAWRLRWWLLGIPAGTGLATLRATLKLWMGFPTTSSGVWSAGNGPAMRSAVLGAAIEDPVALRAFVDASTRLTHTDPKATYGAMAVAIATQSAVANIDPAAFLHRLRCALPDSDAGELIDRIETAVDSAATGEDAGAFAARMGSARGVSGYIYHTVPVAIQAWLRFGRDYSSAVQSVIRCGGDTDTVAAIVGGIIGAATGVEGAPAAWRERLAEWPRSTTWIQRLAAQTFVACSESRPVVPPRVGPLVVVRNAFFASIVFAHIGRRMLPPY